jgi:hypothetical protein
MQDDVGLADLFWGKAERVDLLERGLVVCDGGRMGL